MCLVLLLYIESVCTNIIYPESHFCQLFFSLHKWTRNVVGDVFIPTSMARIKDSPHPTVRSPGKGGMTDIILSLYRVFEANKASERFSPYTTVVMMTVRTMSMNCNRAMNYPTENRPIFKANNLVPTLQTECNSSPFFDVVS